MVFCGLVYLYTQTKDRWDWSKLKRILLWLLIAPIILALIVWGGNYLYEEYQDRPREPTELNGVKLGEDFSDVVFKFGKPIIKQDSDVKDIQELLSTMKTSDGQWERMQKVLKDRLEKQSKLQKNNDLTRYIFPNDVDVMFKNKKADFIYVDCRKNSFEKINGIGCYGSSASIQDKFGINNIRVLCSLKADKDSKDLYRAYDIVKYGTRYYLEKDSVFGLAIASSKTLKEAINMNWGKCE